MNRETDINTPIGIENDKPWDENKLAGIKNFITGENAKRTDVQRMETKLLAIRLKMQDYLENERVMLKEMHTIDNFLNLHLKALNLSYKKFAKAIGTTDSNLKKYVTISGNRKFNVKLAMKFGHFFNNGPHLWMRVQVKNEMIVYAKKESEFKKYDYRKLLKEESKQKVRKSLPAKSFA